LLDVSIQGWLNPQMYIKRAGRNAAVMGHVLEMALTSTIYLILIWSGNLCLSCEALHLFPVSVYTDSIDFKYGIFLIASSFLPILSFAPLLSCLLWYNQFLLHFLSFTSLVNT
jgi:hypothetical protein